MVDRVVEPSESFLMRLPDVLPLDTMLLGKLVVTQCHHWSYLPTRLLLMDYGSENIAVVLELAWQLDLLLCKVWAQLDWRRMMLYHPSFWFM